MWPYASTRLSTAPLDTRNPQSGDATATSRLDINSAVLLEGSDEIDNKPQPLKRSYKIPLHRSPEQANILVQNTLAIAHAGPVHHDFRESESPCQEEFNNILTKNPVALDWYKAANVKSNNFFTKIIAAVDTLVTACGFIPTEEQTTSIGNHHIIIKIIQQYGLIRDQIDPSLRLQSQLPVGHHTNILRDILIRYASAAIDNTTTSQNYDDAIIACTNALNTAYREYFIHIGHYTTPENDSTRPPSPAYPTSSNFNNNSVIP